MDKPRPVDKSFISEEFTKRKSDLIYRVKRGDREVYIYILIEFQSTPDKTIAADFPHRFV
jgi:predicted transposase YdaD